MRSLAAFVFAAFLALPAQAAPRIALTFDDLPSHSDLPPGESRVEIARAIIAALKQVKTPPVWGFVNGVRLTDDAPSAPVLKMWRDAGFRLGNHTYSHMDLNEVPLADWEKDVLKNEPILAPLTRNYRWLRFPYLDEGETLAKHRAARLFLARHGYRIAAVTLNFDDWQWNDVYPLCVARHDGDAVARMEAAFLAAADKTLVYERDLAKQLYGRDVAFVLLLHLGAFDARMLPRLLKLYEDRGVRFISLEDAERDPFYRAAIHPGRPPAPVDLDQAMEARGVRFSEYDEKVLPFGTMCR